MVVGYVAGIAIADFSWSMAEAVPDRLTASIGVNSTFDLIGSRRSAPQEPTWEPLRQLLRPMLLCHAIGYYRTWVSMAGSQSFYAVVPQLRHVNRPAGVDPSWTDRPSLRTVDTTHSAVALKVTGYRSGGTCAWPSMRQ